MIHIFLTGIMYGIFLYAILVGAFFPLVSWWAKWLQRPKS